MFPPYNNLPRFICSNGRFCLWKYPKNSNRKIPYQVNGKKVLTNRINTFTDYKTALKNVKNFDGIGIGVFDGISAIDVDDCINNNGSLTALAKDAIEILKDYYIEISPSKRGLRILFAVDKDFCYDKEKYYINNQKMGLEIYISGSTNRFLTITGDVLNKGNTFKMQNPKLLTLLDKYMVRPKLGPLKPVENSNVVHISDDFLLKKAFSCSNKFKNLWNGETTGYPSQSEADFALCILLAFWCNRDIDQMDRLFRKSSLMRDKWDREQGDSTYGNITLKKAAMSAIKTYHCR